MFRLSGKIVQKNQILQSYVFQISKEYMPFEVLLRKGIEDLCNRFDIANPMLLVDNTMDMKQIKKMRFKSHHFIEDIDFDYFEIEYLTEDK